MEKQRWLNLQENGWQIVIPDFDTKPHANKLIKKGKMEVAGFDCPCKPKIAMQERIIIHNSFIDEERISKSMVVNLYENPAEFDLI